MIGRQRYESLLRFFDNKFKLKDVGLQKLKDWGGRNYENLAPNLRTLFEEFKIKMICYMVPSSMFVSDEDLERVGRDLFRRYNFGMASLKPTDIARAKYCYDKLTRRFRRLLKKEINTYEKWIEFFAIGSKKKLEEREKFNLLLITIREFITMPCIPIIGERNLQCNRKVIDRYYDKFFRQLTDKQQDEKIEEFKKIFENLTLIREKLKEVNNKLQDDVRFFKSVYWMFSILYYVFPNKFYDFNIDKFCHYVEDNGEDYFETYNRMSGQDTQKRMGYMKEYLEKELKLDINIYLERIKENKKAIMYKKDTEISKDRDWKNPLIMQRLKARKETMEMSEVIKHVKDKRLIIRPDYQRGEILDRKKASRAVESVMLGVRLPPIYLYTELQENGLDKDIILDRTAKID